MPDIQNLKTAKLKSSFTIVNLSTEQDVRWGLWLLSFWQAQFLPWHEIAIDLISLWEVEEHWPLLTKTQNDCEIIKIINIIASNIGTNAFKTCVAVYIQGLCIAYLTKEEGMNIKSNKSHVRHELQQHPAKSSNKALANAICKRLYQTVANGLKALIHHNSLKNFNDATLLIDTAISSAMYAKWSNSSLHMILLQEP